MEKYKFLIFVIPLFFTLFCICDESNYSLAAEPSIVGTWSGGVKDIGGDGQGQLTIDITNDTVFYETGMHYIEGTVTLTDFPLCFTQGVFSSEIGEGVWHESRYGGQIRALGRGFSEAWLIIEISTNLTEILIRGVFQDSSGNRCLYVGNSTLRQQTTEPPYSDFSANPILGRWPLTVNFTDQSTGSITSREWDFGDGLTSTTQNPSHTYTDPGSYTVTLTVAGPEGSDTETKPNYIKVKSTSSAKTMPWIQLLLDSGNHPVANITNPSHGSFFMGGDEIIFAGTGTDLEDGKLFGNYLAAIIQQAGKPEVLGFGANTTESRCT